MVVIARNEKCRPNIKLVPKELNVVQNKTQFRVKSMSRLPTVLLTLIIMLLIWLIIC